MVYSDQIVAVKFHIFAFFYDRRMKVRQISRQSHAYKLRYIILADKSETRFLLLGCYHIKMATREIPFFFFFFVALETQDWFLHLYGRVYAKNK